MDKEPRVEFAPREAIKFTNEEIEDCFLTFVLGHPEAWISDGSRISDFLSSWDISYALRPSDKAGFYVFEETKPYLPPANVTVQERLKHISEHEWETYEVVRKGKDHKGEITRRAQLVFGVDITSVFKENFPVVFQHIAKNLTDQKKAELLPGGKLARRRRFYLNHPLRHHSTYWWTNPTHRFKTRRLVGGAGFVWEAEGIPEEGNLVAEKYGPWDQFMKFEVNSNDWVLAARRIINEKLKEQDRLPLKKLDRE